MKIKLTDQRVKSLPLPSPGGPQRKEYWDDSVPGLVLRVTAKGSRSFAFRHRRAGKTQMVTIGDAATVPLSLARDAAKQMFAKLTRGEDPAPPTMSLKAAVEYYDSLHLRRNGLKSADEVMRVLRKHVLPTLGAKNLPDITRTHVLALTDRLIKDGKPTAANQVHTALRGVLNFCTSRDYLRRSPMEGMRLPTKLKSRERVLSEAELDYVWLSTRGRVNAYNTIVRLLILTLARRNEVAGACWEEFQNSHSVWVIPASRTKNNRAHVIPMSSLARETLIKWHSATHDHLSPFVFPSRGTKRDFFSGFSKSKSQMDKTIAANATMAPWHLHDLRRSSATFLEERGVRPRVIQRLLNHTTGGEVTPVGSIYLRGEHWMPMVQAVARLAEQFGSADD